MICGFGMNSLIYSDSTNIISNCPNQYKDYVKRPMISFCRFQSYCVYDSNCCYGFFYCSLCM